MIDSVRKKKLISVVVIMLCMILLCACEHRGKEIEMASGDKGNAESTESAEGEPNAEKQEEKGYDLPVDPQERKEAEENCKKMMNLVREIYEQADKGSSLNAVLSDKALSAMRDKLKESGVPVTAPGLYANMENFESVDNFLQECVEGRSGSAVVYEIRTDGGIGRKKFLFDGTGLFVLNASAAWNDKNEPETAHVSHMRVEEWDYTEKGFLRYRLCVPGPPEVTEIVDGSCLLRVKPITAEKLREYAVFDEENDTYAWEGLIYSGHIRTYSFTVFGSVFRVTFDSHSS